MLLEERVIFMLAALAAMVYFVTEYRQPEIIVRHPNTTGHESISVVATVRIRRRKDAPTSISANSTQQLVPGAHRAASFAAAPPASETHLTTAEESYTAVPPEAAAMGNSHKSRETPIDVPAETGGEHPAPSIPSLWDVGPIYCKLHRRGAGVVVLDPKHELDAQLTEERILNKATSRTELILTMLHAGPEMFQQYPIAARFLSSLRRTGSNATVVIFSNDSIEKKLRRLIEEKYRVTVIKFTHRKEYKGDGYWVSSLRYLMYRLALERLPTFTRVMISDSFDVIFQSDPFRYAEGKLTATGKSLIAAEEVAIFGKPNQLDDGLNERWIRRCFGGAAGRVSLAGKHVLCSGTTIGVRDVMEEYIREVDDISRLQSEVIPVTAPYQCSQLGFDQGVHNFLMYSKFADKMTTESPFSGRFLTVNGIKTFRLRDKQTGFQVNEQGKLFVFVHQVNRCGVRKKDAIKFQVLNASSTQTRGVQFIPAAGVNCDIVPRPPHLGDLKW